jgi:hypothetical protein
VSEVVTPSSLRSLLADLAGKRGDHCEARHELEQKIGEALVEVRETPGITLTEAAQLLGLSRPTAYRLLEEAQR